MLEDKSTPPNIRAVARWDVDVLPMPRRRQMVEVNQPFARSDLNRIQLGSWPEVMRTNGLRSTNTLTSTSTGVGPEYSCTGFVLNRTGRTCGLLR